MGEACDKGGTFCLRYTVCAGSPSTCVEPCTGDSDCTVYNTACTGKDGTVRFCVEKKPEPPKRPDTPQQMSQQEQQVQGPKMDIDLPKIDVPTGAGGTGMFIPAGATYGKGGGGFGDGDLIPIVRIEPQWPREALVEGISGYVVVSFVVMEDGSVEPGSVKVTESKPPRLFDSSAMRAVARWKFKPRIVDGKPVKRTATQTLAFNLQDEDKK